MSKLCVFILLVGLAAAAAIDAKTAAEPQKKVRVVFFIGLEGCSGRAG